MLLLEAKHIEKSYGERLIIQEDHLQVYYGQRIGLVGQNGAGKSTLLKILVQELHPDKGTIQVFCPFAYIPQLELLERNEMNQHVKSEWNIPGEEHALSGGEETRKKIATALSSPAQLLIADEPTSHLDVQGIEKFEQAIREFKGAVILISHDRELLNQACTSIWEVNEGKLYVYEGNYDSYVKQKEQRKNRERLEYEQYIKEKQRLEQAAREKSQKSQSMKKAPSRMGNSEARLHKGTMRQKKVKLDKEAKAILSRMAQLEKKEKPKTEENIVFDLNHFRQIHSKTVVSFEQVSVRAGERRLFNGLHGAIKPGDKVAILGKNGVGKSTLLHMIAQAHEGITLAKPAAIGFFHQQLENLDEQKSILENVQETSRYTERFIRTVLARLLFKREEVYKKVHLLSGGERVKTALVKMFLGDYNVLLLDEPTNYLDLQTKEALITVLKAYPGTILFVTHDRFFIKELATHQLVIENNKANIRDVGQVDRTEKSLSKQELETKRLALEIELTETISKLSFPSSAEEKQALEEKYQALLIRKKQLG